MLSALVFCRDSGTEIFVRDYEAPALDGMQGEQLLETRPDDRQALEQGKQGNHLLPTNTNAYTCRFDG